MFKFSKFALLGAVLAVSAQYASALPVVFGEINFSGNGGLSGVSGSLLPLTVTAPVADLAVATGSFAIFPTLPNFLQPVNVVGFTNLAVPVTIFFTSTTGITVSYTATTFISSSVNASSFSELLGGILAETGYQSAFSILDLTSVANSTTFTADVIASTPEPNSLILLGTGLMSAAGVLVRRRTATA